MVMGWVPFIELRRWWDKEGEGWMEGKALNFIWYCLVVIQMKFARYWININDIKLVQKDSKGHLNCEKH